MPQRGAWDTGVAEVGQRGGIFKKHGLVLELLYTQGGPESIQAVISGSMDMAVGVGISAALATFSKGAPIRIIGSEMIGSPDLYWYVKPNSPDSQGRGFHRQDCRLFAERHIEPRRPARTPAAVQRQGEADRGRRHERDVAAIDVGTDRRRLGRGAVRPRSRRGRQNPHRRRAAATLPRCAAVRHASMSPACRRSRKTDVMQPFHARLSRDGRLDVRRSRGAQALRANIRDCQTQSCAGARLHSEGDHGARHDRRAGSGHRRRGATQVHPVAVDRRLRSRNLCKFPPSQ